MIFHYIFWYDRWERAANFTPRKIASRARITHALMAEVTSLGEREDSRHVRRLL